MEGRNFKVSALAPFGKIGITTISRPISDKFKHTLELHPFLDKIHRMSVSSWEGKDRRYTGMKS
jgi:hypothetical protein